MSSVTKAIDLDVPVRVTYTQWAQFEQFPEFMEGGEEVLQFDAQLLH